MTRSAKQPSKSSKQADTSEQEYGPKEIALDDFHNHLVGRLELLRSFLTTVFSEAAHAGLTKQEVMRAMMRHHDLIGEPNLPTGDLPEKAPELYAERADKTETPLEFYDRVWGAYQFILYREDIERLGDNRLIPAIYSFCQRKNIDPSLVVPPTARKDQDALVAGLTEQEIQAAHRFVARQDVKRHRSRQTK